MHHHLHTESPTDIFERMTQSDTTVFKDWDPENMSRKELTEKGIDNLPTNCSGLSRATPDNTQNIVGTDLFVLVATQMKGTFSIIHLIPTDNGYKGSRFDVPISGKQITQAIRNQTPGLSPNTEASGRKASYVVYIPKYEKPTETQ